MKRVLLLSVVALLLAFPSIESANAAGAVVIQDANSLGRTVVVNSDGSINVNSNSVPIGTTFVPATTALSTSAALVLASGTFASRIACNADASITEYAGGSGVTSAGTAGVTITPGTCWDFSHTTAAIYLVAASGTPNAKAVQY